MAARYTDNPFTTPATGGMYRGQQTPPLQQNLRSPFASSADHIPMNDSTTDFTAGTYLPAGARPARFNNNPNYVPMPESTPPLRSSPWLEKQQSRSQRSKWIVIGALVTIVAIIIAVAVGVTVAKQHSKPTSLAASGSGTSSADGAAASGSSSTGSSSSDPSNFVKNPALHNAFYGIAYTPIGAVLPSCGANQADVITDIQLLSQVTTRIRLYGADCNVTALVLNAIKLTKVSLQVYLGNFLVMSDNTAFTRQKALIESALTTYGADSVVGITVGNEVMLNYCTDQNLTDASNDALVMPAVTYITTSIAQTRAGILALNLGKTLQIGNSDAGSYFNHLVLEASDYGMANVHPWFAQQDVAAAAAWTTTFFQDTDVAEAASTVKKPTMYIAETGWPTASDDAAHQSDGFAGPGGEASVANLQTFLDTFVCSSNTGGILYFYFELFDEAWKAPVFGGVEAHWGLFDENKNLKNITMPTCSHP